MKHRTMRITAKGWELFEQYWGHLDHACDELNKPRVEVAGDVFEEMAGLAVHVISGQHSLMLTNNLEKRMKEHEAALKATLHHEYALKSLAFINDVFNSTFGPGRVIATVNKETMQVEVRYLEGDGESNVLPFPSANVGDATH